MSTRSLLQQKPLLPGTPPSQKLLTKLMGNRSMQYMQLFSAHKKLEDRFESARQAYEELNVRYSTLTSPRGTRPLCLPTCYWTEAEILAEAQQHNSAKGKATMTDMQSKRGSKCLSEDDANIMFPFIEDKDGNMVSGGRIRAVRAHARKIWIYLYNLGRLQPHWNDVDSVVRSYYAGEMCLTFPELQLCELDCKSHRIATLSFPGWYKSYSAGHESKADPDELDTKAMAVVSGSKRSPSGNPDGEHILKKSKHQSKNCASAPVSVAVSIATVPVTASPPIQIPAIATTSLPIPTDATVTASPPAIPAAVVIPTDGAQGVATQSNPTPLTAITPVGGNEMPAAGSVAATSITVASAAAPVVIVPGPSSSGVDDPLPNLVIGLCGEDYETGREENLCLQDYIAKNGKVTKPVFDLYYNGLSKDEKKCILVSLHPTKNGISTLTPETPSTVYKCRVRWEDGADGAGERWRSSGEAE
ncbi:hypothetical protein C8R44DRAFT_745256 [Mycena epipterygia]|nr:hypothetical protein C8R44DRAFT_745256 [Mycena epipterygia]